MDDFVGDIDPDLNGQDMDIFWAIEALQKFGYQQLQEQYDKGCLTLTEFFWVLIISNHWEGGS